MLAAPVRSVQRYFEISMRFSILAQIQLVAYLGDAVELFDEW